MTPNFILEMNVVIDARLFISIKVLLKSTKKLNQNISFDFFLINL